MLDKLTSLYDTVYYAPELRAQRKLAGGEAGLSEKHQESLDNLKTTGQRVQRFFGLPAGDSLKEVAKNFSFWQSKYSDNLLINTVLKILWGISLLIVLPIQLSLVVFKCLRNILKLGTEFLPRLLADGFYFAFVFLKGKAEVSGASIPAKAFFGFLAFLSGALFLAFKLCYLIGRATTSPVESVRASFGFGKSKHLVLGVLLAGLSVAVTACVYAILFPLAIKFILVQAAAALPSFPQWVMSMFFSIAKLGSGFAQFLFPHLPLSFFITFCSPVSISLMAGLSLVGFTLFGSGTAVGAVVDRATDPSDDNHAKPCLEAIVERGEKPVSVAVFKGVFRDQDVDRTPQIAELQSEEHGKRSLISPALGNVDEIV